MARYVLSNGKTELFLEEQRLIYLLEPTSLEGLVGSMVGVLIKN
jgi:hypothetical protein